MRQVIETFDGLVHGGPADHVGDQDPRPRVRGQVHDLLAGQQNGRRHGDGAALHRPEEDDRILEAIGKADEHPLAGVDAEIAQEPGETAGVARQLGEGRLAHARLVVVDDHRGPLLDGRAEMGIGTRHADVELLGEVPDPGREFGHGGQRNAGITFSAKRRAGSRVSRPKNSITRRVQPSARCWAIRSITRSGVPQMPCASRPAPMWPP